MTPSDNPADEAQKVPFEAPLKPTFDTPHNELETGRVLMIDDESKHLQLALEMLLGLYQLEIQTALDGPTGLEMAEQAGPDLILLDVRMPGMDGFEVCRRLKANPLTRAIPVIFLTGQSEFEDKLTGFKLGGVDYVTKPFDAPELMLRITNHLRLARRIMAVEPAAGEHENELTSLPSGTGLEPSSEDAAGPPPQWPACSVDAARSLDRLLKARNLLKNQLTAPPDIPALARQVGTNRTTLQQLFQEHLGMTIFGYLREQRLQQARILLGTPGLKIDTVAASVGYANGRDLARAFRQRFGVTPTEYVSGRPEPSPPDG